MSESNIVNNGLYPLRFKFMTAGTGRACTAEPGLFDGMFLCITVAGL